MEPVQLQCQFCKNTFVVPKFRIDSNIRNFGYSQKFCSRKCNCQAHKTNNPTRINLPNVECKYCHKIFHKLISNCKRTKNNFCSKSCSAKYNNTHKTNGTRRSKMEIWIEQELYKLYPTTEFQFNKKDAINSELDIYIPSLKLAFELNGIFHYEPIYGKNKLDEIKTNDTRKFQACLERGIELCIIDTSSVINFKEKKSIKFLDIIKNIINSKLL